MPDWVKHKHMKMKHMQAGRRIICRRSTIICRVHHVKWLGWMKHKLESRLLGDISITSDMQMTPPYGKKWRETEEPFDESEGGEWKSWLKTQHSKNKDRGIRSYHFVTNRWVNNGNSERLYFLGLQITADDGHSCEFKRHLLLGREAVTNLDSISKSRDITLPTKVRLVKAVVFPVVIYECESWTIKLSAEELMLLNCGVGEDSWESLGLQGDPTSPF